VALKDSTGVRRTPSSDAFDPETWKGKWTAILENAKAKQTPAGQLVHDTRDLFEELAKAGKGAVLLFWEPLRAMFPAKPALADDYALNFVANRLGLTPEDVAANLGVALERAADKRNLQLKGPDDVKSLDLVGLGGKPIGKVLFSDITATRAHITLCPAHTSIFPERGGGEAGGVEKFWRDRAQLVGAKAFVEATHGFEKDRGAETLRPGTTGEYDSGFTNVEQGPLKIIVGATVPKVGLRRSQMGADADEALIAQAEAHQLEMTAIMFREALTAAAALQADPAMPKFTEDNPCIISKPIFCTGPDGSVLIPQAAKGDRQVLDPSSPVHKKILAELAAQGIKVPPFRIDTCYYAPYKDGDKITDALKAYASVFEGKELANTAYPTARERFTEYLGPMGKDGGGHRPFDERYVSARVGDVVDDLLGILKAIPDDVLKDAKADPGYVSTFFKALGTAGVNMTFQLAKMVQMPDLAEKFGVTSQDFKTRVQELFANADFRDKITGLVLHHHAFADSRTISEADHHRLADVISSGMEMVMQEARWQHLEDFYAKYEKEMAQVTTGMAGQLEGLKEKLGSFEDLKARVEALTTQNAALEEQAGQLAEELTAALDAKDAALGQNSQLAKELAAALKSGDQIRASTKVDADDLRKQIESLRDQLVDQKALVRKYKDKAEAQQPYYRSPPSVSTASS
jgi:hypothetical protein